jgi:hypothetical protein
MCTSGIKNWELKTYKFWKMKTINFYSICLIFISVLTSCVKTDDFDLPTLEVIDIPVEGNLTTIAAVKGHFSFQTNQIYTFRNTNAYFEGYVISSDEGGNFYKKLVLQDKTQNPTAGIQMLIDNTSLFNTYNFGRKVFVKLDGLSLGYKNGSLQLGLQNRGDIIPVPQSILDEHIIRTNEAFPITPLKIDIQDFQQKYKNLYILLENVQFNRNLIREEHRFTFSSESIDRFDGERQLESCVSGATTNLSTSTFADFRSLLLPRFSGSIEGVLTRNFYDDYFILVINTPEALKFEAGERCDPVFFSCGNNTETGIDVVFQEGFETITTVRMLETKGWVNVNINGGSKRFEPGTLAGNRHVRISAYNTQETPLEAWLITPAIKLSETVDELLSFDIRASFDNATILEVYITNNFSGNPRTTEWKLLEANIPVGPTNQAGTNFTRSEIDLACMEGTVHIAFRYLGTALDKTTTYDIDNVRVTGNN